jgi:tRNA-intron endonuclease
MATDIQAQLIGNSITSNSKKAYSLAKQSSFGEHIGEKVKYMLEEALYLVEKKKMEVSSGNKILKESDLIKKFTRIDKKFQIKYAVYKNLRSKGYLVKTALKFGAEFRVYEKGKKPGKIHAKWIVFTDSENNKLSWNEFSAKNRVAHSTKKKILLAIVDAEENISYYEVNWIKP